MPRTFKEIEDREAALEIAKMVLAQRDFESYCERMIPGYISAPHTKMMVSYLECLILGRSEEHQVECQYKCGGKVTQLMIFVPFRHGKSIHCSQCAPAFFLGHFPTLHTILASHTAGKAEDNSEEVRKQLTSDKWPWLGQVALSASTASKERWKTEQGGGCLAKGVGAQIVGYGADLLIIDDPVGGDSASTSETERENAWNWYTKEAQSRMNPTGPRLKLIIMTRWSDDDLAGRILAREADQWTVLRLPALAEEDDPLGRQKGQALWPQAYDEKYFAQQRELMGSRAFEAVYQQNPIPAGGGTFKIEWFNNTYKTPPRNLFKIVTVDSAWKEGVENDWSVMACWGTDRKYYYLLDVLRIKVEYPKLKKLLPPFVLKNEAAGVYVEETAAGIPLVAELKATPMGFPVIGVKVGNTNHEVRAEAITPLFEGQLVYLPEEAPWKEAWVREHMRFPGGDHDDQVDTTSLALSKLSPMLRRRPDDRTYDGFMGR